MRQGPAVIDVGTAGLGQFPALTLGGLMLINLAIIVQEGARRGATSGAAGRGKRWLWRHRLAFGVLALFAPYMVGVPLGLSPGLAGILLLAQLALGVRRPRAWRSP